MSDDLFREGGPHRIRRTGRDEYEMSITLPQDEHGMVGRECSREGCSPAYFKVKPGTGITGEQEIAYCPYCRSDGHPTAFHTKAQQDYAKRVVENEAVEAMQRMLGDALGLGPAGRKELGGGMFSIEMSLQRAPRRHVSRPLEEELRRDLHCASCGLEHAVFGLAFWCPDCGTDLFLDHVHEELEVTRRILGAVEERRAALGARVAARDVENALEDTVSLFEAVLKLVTRRVLLARGLTEEQVDDTFRRHVRNSYQSVVSAAGTFQTQVGLELFADIDEPRRAALASVFEKRHPITHNLGVVDRNYLRRAQSGELEGREVRVTTEEVREAVDIAVVVLRSAYTRTTPPDAPSAS
jgi:predicted RNA-binding Zn-ribbon protein involved in translation (DUF1610 family)